MEQKFCKHCGQSIDKDCVICPKCGKQVEQLNGYNNGQPIIINNNNNSSSSSSSSASASVTVSGRRTRKKYNLLFDLFMICITAGLWLIWMLVRPKYE